MENTVEKEKEANPFQPIDVFLFKKHIKSTLLNILESMPQEKKKLIMEKSCIKKLDFFSDIKSIQEKKVDETILMLEDVPVKTDCKSIVYIVPPKTECLENIKIHVTANLNERDKKYFVILIPRIDYVCQKFIEENYLSAELKIFNLMIDVYPLDYDLLSLEEPATLEEVFVNKNYNILAQMNRVIMKFEAIFGSIKYKYLKGENAKRLKELVEAEEANSKFNNDTEILAAMFFDRSIDFVTPFCTQGTYQGVLDEKFNIKFNHVRVKGDILEKDVKTEFKIDLSNEDKFYSIIKHYNFSKIRVFLPNRLKEHDSILTKGKETTDLTEMQITLGKVKNLRDERASLLNHINIASTIGQEQVTPRARLYNYIEQGLLAGVDYTSMLEDFINDEISRRTEPYYVLKLICLYSTIQNGLNSKLYLRIKREFMHSYGYQMIFVWMNLEKLGILKTYQARGSYLYLVDNLELIKENVNQLEPDDCSYVFGGYCPIMLRLIERAVTKGWNSIRLILQKLPGEAEFPNDETEIVAPKEAKNFILLVFIGGITYAEIGAIRYLSEKMKKHKFIILTSNIVHGKRIFENLAKETNNKFTFKEFYNQIKKAD